DREDEHDDAGIISGIGAVHLSPISWNARLLSAFIVWQFAETIIRGNDECYYLTWREGPLRCVIPVEAAGGGCRMIRRGFVFRRVCVLNGWCATNGIWLVCQRRKIAVRRHGECHARHEQCKHAR